MKIIIDRKASKVFDKLKHKSKDVNNLNNNDPSLDEQDDEPDFNQMRTSAMKSLHLTDEVLNTDEGFVA